MSAEGVRIVVVGIGADGWSGLGEPARAAIRSADEIIGSPRQLETLPTDGPPLTAWPSPMAPAIEALCARMRGTVCVVASGDPMLHGVGASIVARLPDPERLTVIPHVSAFQLACARLGWPIADVELVSAVARPPDVLARALQPGRRIVAYVTGTQGAAQAARVLCERGLGASRFIVLEALGTDAERVRSTTAELWGDREAGSLHAVAIEVAASVSARVPARVPGMPDGAFEHDGALTKRYIRAATLAALAPLPGALLWDVGAGSGSIAIEWLRAEATARAIAVEPQPERAQRIARNALSLGVPALGIEQPSSSKPTPPTAPASQNAPSPVANLPLRIICGRAPEALAGLEAPDVIFIGGGLTGDGVLDACWAALKPGGRIVANAVTLETEQRLIAARADHGGELVRLEVAHAEPLGGFTGWRPQMPVVLWSCDKPGGPA